MSELYLIPNYAMVTAANPAVVATGTAIKTMLQVKIGALNVVRGRIVEWGISFDGAAAAAGVNCWLGTTSTVKATITEHVATGIQNLDPLAAAPTDDNPFAFGAAGDETGFTASAEGTVTATRTLDSQLVQPTGQYVKQFPLGREPQWHVADFLRIRVLAAATVGCLCYVIVEV